MKEKHSYEKKPTKLTIADLKRMTNSKNSTKYILVYTNCHLYAKELIKKINEFTNRKSEL